MMILMYLKCFLKTALLVKNKNASGESLAAGREIQQVVHGLKGRTGKGLT